jgi:hypothetical protein
LPDEAAPIGKQVVEDLVEPLFNPLCPDLSSIDNNRSGLATPFRRGG